MAKQAMNVCPGCSKHCPMGSPRCKYGRKYFEKLASRLEGYTEVCTFSFLDIYRNTLKNMKGIMIRELEADVMHKLAKAFAEAGRAHGIKLQTCAEAVELGMYGISHARCVDGELFERITGYSYRYSKDPNQRNECGCLTSVDIGAYDSCMHGCSYCYATHSPALPASNAAKHDAKSPLLIGRPEADDRITDRKNSSPVIRQQMFDI